MNRLRSLLPFLALAAVFIVSAWHVLGTRRAATDSDRVTIRVGHWLLHAGMRESFDEAAAEYMRLNPHVSVEQIPVPIRTWPSWLRTQLVGGTAPDITGLLSANEELTTRHFIPITDRIGEANPYNAGTPLEGVPWVDTFVDGMAAMRGLTPTSGDVHSVNLQVNTLRLFYNKRLLHAVTGSTEPPADYAALRELEERVARHNRERGDRLVPIASCGPYSQFLFERLLPSQTQKLAIELSPGRDFQLPVAEQARLALSGRLSFRETPELRASLGLLRDVSSLMTVGYESRQRDDALFDFLQQKAVMICAGSWDYGVFVRDGDFPVGIMPVVLPTPADPVYGRFVLGLASEANGSPEATLGVVRTSRHPEIALDFLRFLTSHGIARKFTEQSMRMSAVAEVPPPANAPELAPRLDGEINGFMPDFNYFGGGNGHLVFKRNLHMLMGPTGSVDAFAAKLDAELPAALARDVDVNVARVRRDIQRLDALIGLMLTRPDGEDEAWTRLMENRHARQVEYHTYRPRAE